jgi:hypothetical protein
VVLPRLVHVDPHLSHSLDDPVDPVEIERMELRVWREATLQQHLHSPRVGAVPGLGDLTYPDAFRAIWPGLVYAGGAPAVAC